ncbi:MAG: hypothetical protein U0797_24780 [Gemmataceae bacterium]
MSTLLQHPPASSPTNSMASRNPLWTERAALVVQGGYFLMTGLWPLFAIDSFQAVTGPKTDLWLVRTVGVLIAVIGGVLLMAVRNDRPPLEVFILAVGAAVGLAMVDLVIVLTRTAPPIYLLDAAIEGGLLLWWVGLRKPASPGVVQFPSADIHRRA